MKNQVTENKEETLTAAILGVAAGLAVYWYMSGDEDRKRGVNNFVKRYSPFVMTLLGGVGNKLLGDEE